MPNEQRHLVQLNCGHFLYFPSLSATPEINEEVPCFRCPHIDDHVQTQRVRISPKAESASARCLTCRYIYNTRHNRQEAWLRGRRHARVNAHIVKLVLNGKTVETLDCTQEQINYDGEPTF